MNHSDFVHLHLHSQYSLLDGACRIDDIIEKAKVFNMPAVAMTDHGNIFGALEFYQAAKKNEIKPIIGCEAYVLTQGSRHEKTFNKRDLVSHLVLLIKNEEGYHNLCKLVSASYLDGFYYQPRIDKELLRQYSRGLVATSACLKGELAGHILSGNYNSAVKAADEYRSILGKGNFFLEVMDHGIREQKKVNESLLKISKELDIPIVVTNDVHYLERSQFAAHEGLLCIQTQSNLNDPNRMRMNSDQYYFKSPDEMRQQFDWVPNGMQNTLKIAEMCDMKFDFDKIHLPRFDPPNGQTKEDYLKELCRDGLRKRYNNEVSKEIVDRLKHEIKTIEKMGFVSYFLIVWDFINYAKQKGIPVGPGRGSAAGSLVSYLLGITDLDPLKYGLLFERFLNPDRTGMPDIDIDFCFERRGEVIEYVTAKYGKENVAQIITFGTMLAKAAIRDVGRVKGVSYTDVDRIAKLVPNELGITIDDALIKEPQFKKLYEEDSVAADIIDTAKVLEGLTRHASTHAAGVVISDKPLYEHVPLYKTNEDQISTGFDMKGIEKIGLLKMDFLGLRTLTVINEAVKLIKRIHHVDIDMSKIPLTDNKTYALLGRANTFGVFQLESSGMRELLKKTKPTELEDVISILALYRPGPMGSGMLDDFIKRKRGQVTFKYDHPLLEPILKETYGIIVYQEQVMKICVALAGFSMTQADHLRRAMSKKIQSVMDKMRSDFVNGCINKNKINESLANKLFDLIDYFSGYGFNRSHSAAYAVISYHTAYLKANYPVEFMCALLNSELSNTDKIVEYVKEAEAMGIEVLPPDINESIKVFNVLGPKTVRFGLLAVKNVGSSAIDSIVENREKSGKYSSVYDLCERVDLRLVNKKVVESLIKCGAFDSFHAFRSQLMVIMEMALEVGTRSQKEKSSGQVSFFEMAGGTSGFSKNEQILPNIKEWQQNKILSYEKEVLGFYLSGHPLAHYQVEIKEFTNNTTKNLKNAIDGEEVRLVGLIDSVKLTNTRKTNERMAILKVEDLEGQVEVVVFPSSYEELVNYLVEGEVVFIKGKVSFRDEEPKIIASSMSHMHDIYSSIKAIKVDLSTVGEDGLVHLKNKLANFPGAIPVYLKVNTNAHKSVQILVGEDFYVSPNETLMNEIKEIVGKNSFSVTL